MKFIKIKNSLINLEKVNGLFIKENRLYIRDCAGESFIVFRSEDEADQCLKDIMEWLGLERIFPNDNDI